MTTKKRKDVEVFSVSLPVRSRSVAKNKADLAKFAQQVEDIANAVRGDGWSSVQTMTFDGHGVIFIATRSPEPVPDARPPSRVSPDTIRLALPLWNNMNAALAELPSGYTTADVEAVIGRFITGGNSVQAKALVMFLCAQVEDHKRMHPDTGCESLKQLTEIIRIVEEKIKFSVC